MRSGEEEGEEEEAKFLGNPSLHIIHIAQPGCIISTVFVKQRGRGGIPIDRRFLIPHFPLPFAFVLALGFALSRGRGTMMKSQGDVTIHEQGIVASMRRSGAGVRRLGGTG